ncbi:MAG: ATP-dependent Clp protease adapter ClpS [Pseudomonadota bacterium]
MKIISSFNIINSVKGTKTNPDEKSHVQAVATKPKPKPKKPSLYRVLMLNDDYTTMEFVIYVLEQVFGKSLEDATRIMLNIHQTGIGVCGVFTFEIAETKVYRVLDLARQNEHPLQCVMEKDS